MVAAFLDTSVVIDILRGYPSALTWQQKQQTLSITRAVWMEILIGSPNKQRQESAIRLMSAFVITDILPSDWEWATQQLSAYHLSYDVGILDCLIAAPSYRLNIPLYTHNLKHFRPLLGNLVMKPY